MRQETRRREGKKRRTKILKFKKDLSWEREIKEYIKCIKENKKVKNGTIYDSVAVMKIIDAIYKSDNIWRKKFF